MTETQPGTHRDTIEVRNPADRQVVGHVPVDSADVVTAKVRELCLFQPE